MPRAVVFGPKILGGMEIMNLKVEQPTYSIKTTIGHLRRRDRMSEMLIAALHDIQIEVGISESIFTRNPDKFPYITTNTRWLYTWRACIEVKAKVMVWDQWLPKSKYSNDKNIMEAAIKNPYYKGKYQYRLVSVNRCRLYIRAIFISNLLSDDMLTIKREYLDGSMISNTQPFHFHPICKPTKLEWLEWKAFIFRNFLAGAYYITPQLQPISSWTGNTLKLNEVSMLECMNWNQPLPTIIEMLPPVWKQILGNIQLPDDDGEYVYKSIQNGVAIAASDGSVVTIDNESYGGHSYSIQAWDTDKHRISGEAPTPHSTNVSSLTTELYGLLASTLLIYILGKKYDTDQNLNASTIITADNKQAIQMGNEWNTPLNISETNTHEYDLWTLLYQLKTAVPLTVSYKWIKGHQDQLKSGEKIYGPFTRPVQLNIQMDHLAKRAAKQSSSMPVRRPVYSTTTMGLYTPHDVYIGDIHEYIQYAMTAKPLIDYLIRKNDWTFDLIQQINWYALECALSKYKSCYRIQIVQLMHDWQFTGTRKQLIGEGEELCPAQCGKAETYMHYLVCRDKQMTTSRNLLLTTFQQRLQILNTYPGTISAFCKILLYGFDDEWICKYNTNDVFESTLINAIDKQKQLGRLALPKGYLVNEWVNLQQLWEKSTNSASNKYDWNREAIVSLHTYAYEMWKMRNSIVHGKTEKSQRAIKKAQLQSKVAQLYQKGQANLTLKEKNYFKLPVEQRQQRGIESLSLWIRIVENIFQKWGAARQETLNDWINVIDEEEPQDVDLILPKVKNRKNEESSDILTNGGEGVSRS